VQDSGKKVRVLFLCTGNSCRSQMAEGWARHLWPGKVEAYSAGMKPHGLDPLAVEAMKEAGVDISSQRSKHVKEAIDIQFDIVITVCSDADENCPVFPGKAKVIHAGFDDPPRLSRGSKTSEEKMGHYRRVRDEIKEFVSRLPGLIKDL
jgi:arsenate reductase